MKLLKILCSINLFLFNNTTIQNENNQTQNKNFVTTSHKYDEAIDSPFRFERLSVYEKNKEINVIIDYYINTKKQTHINTKVNNIFKEEILTKVTSSKRYRQMKILLPNSVENEILDIHFLAKWGQDFTMSSRIYLNPETELRTKISKRGNFKYKVVNKTIFNNNTKKFSYFYDEIFFNVLAKDSYLYFQEEDLLKIKDSESITFESELVNLKTEQIMQTNIANKDLETKLKPGLYKINWTITYKKGINRRKLFFSWEFKVLKNYFGDCIDSYFCFKKEDVNGVLKIIKKENFLI